MRTFFIFIFLLVLLFFVWLLSDHFAFSLHSRYNLSCFLVPMLFHLPMSSNGFFHLRVVGHIWCRRWAVPVLSRLDMQALVLASAVPKRTMHYQSSISIIVVSYQSWFLVPCSLFLIFLNNSLANTKSFNASFSAWKMSCLLPCHSFTPLRKNTILSPISMMEFMS